MKIRKKSPVTLTKMRTNNYNIACTLIFVLITIIFNKPALLSQEYQNIILRDISADINSYSNRMITLKLRFKLIDKKFRKLTFYDRKNQDITFDITYQTDPERPNKEFEKQALTLYRGAEYLVKFTVKSTNEGFVTGELADFRLFALTKLPDGK